MLMYVQLFLKKLNLQFWPTLQTNILVSVSGGQDSAQLFFFVWLIQQQVRRTILLIYCNHLWQKDSIKICLQVLQISYLQNQNVFLPITIEALTNESIARTWRYQWFERVCFFSQTKDILTGHTNSDKVESFLMNLIRGCSTTGLASIATKRTSFCFKYRCFTEKRYLKHRVSSFCPGKQTCCSSTSNRYEINELVVFRPLLLTNRYEINALVNYFLLPIWTDKTNFQLKYLRNRLRYEILPLLRYYLNPNIDQTILRCTTLVTEQNSYLNRVILKLLTYSGSFVLRNQSCTRRILIHNTLILKQLPINIQQKLIAKSLNIVKYGPINSSLIDLILALFSLTSSLSHKKHTQVYYFKNLYLVQTQNYFLFDNRYVII